MKTKITKDQYSTAMRLLGEGKRIIEVVQLTGLTRSCVNNWRRGFGKTHMNENIQIGRTSIEDPVEYLCSMNSLVDRFDIFNAYSFILGMYLGDGCISPMGRTKCLQIALDNKYPNLIELVRSNLKLIFNREPSVYDRSVDRGQKYISNSIHMKIYSINLGILFPHEGSGSKHLRKIELTEWQKRIINPSQLVKGLMMSDGSYFHCNTYNRDNYSFCNASKDICRILTEMLDILGIKYNSHTKKKIGVKGTVLKTHVNVNRREEVKKLHDLIGDKNQIV